MINENSMAFDGYIDNFKVKGGRLTITLTVEDTKKINLDKLTDMTNNAVMIGFKSAQTELPVKDEDDD